MSQDERQRGSKADREPENTSSLQGGQETSASEDLGGTASPRARHAKDHRWTSASEDLGGTASPRAQYARTTNKTNPATLAGSHTPLHRFAHISDRVSLELIRRRIRMKAQGLRRGSRHPVVGAQSRCPSSARTCRNASASDRSSPRILRRRYRHRSP